MSCHNIDLVHKRLSEIKDTTHDPSILFGGMSVVVFGDLFQLKPVHGSYIFDTSKRQSYLWQKIDVSLLTTNHRQAKDRTWAKILNRVCIGQLTDSDMQVLKNKTAIEISMPFRLCSENLSHKKKGQRVQRAVSSSYILSHHINSSLHKSSH